MITNVSVVGVYVRDELAALKFYTDVLGFQQHTYDAFGDYLESPRWITVTPKDQPNLELSLHNPLKWNSEEEAEKMLSTIGYSPLIRLTTSNIEEKYKMLIEKGVTFLTPPMEEEWGTQTVFQDLDGNRFCLVEHKKGA
ncbi:VOC family protein [Bacillus sp. 165]|uniref:VOC family protein n=1 Tax=Bacillus sp. 165 TaxID=1529117 RepID=UPI001ADA9A69|nr:VOC family protein [Bacillus sp. 165]MBO9129837.1 VOC family protein [Bacillus sp. 165]